MSIVLHWYIVCPTRILSPRTECLPTRSVRATRLFLRFEARRFGKEKETPRFSIPEEELEEDDEDGVLKHMFGVANDLVRPIHCWRRRVPGRSRTWSSLVTISKRKGLRPVPVVMRNAASAFQ